MWMTSLFHPLCRLTNRDQGHRKDMQKIFIKRAAAGMKLAKPAVNDRGVVLFGTGAELTDDIIARLSKAGVKQVTVEGHPVNTDVQEKDLGQEIAELHDRFKSVEKDPLMRKIRGFFVERLKERAKEV
jgi:hypothetical protein